MTDTGSMRIIELDASGWLSGTDFYEAVWDAICDTLAIKLPMPANIDVLAEAMVYSPEMVEVQPPYSIRVTGVALATTAVREVVREASSIITDLGRDDGVSIAMSD